MTTFDSTKEALLDLLQSIRIGRTQLPDFQRGWVWDDAHVRSLLASISMSFPIGAVMMLQTGNREVRFKPRLVEGVSLSYSPEPERLILDGQQRLTSLFQALSSGQAVATRDARGKSIRRWYYVDIARALHLNDDREEAIVSLPEDRVIRNFRNEVVDDYSSTEQECAAGLLPLSLVFDNAGLTAWQMKYLQVDSSQFHERLSRWNDLLSTVVQRFQQYQVPLILLRKQTPKEAVCQVFEKVNTGGVALSVFELLTATYAADDYNLRDDWAERSRRLSKYRVLDGMTNTDFLQAVTLLATRDRRLRAIEQGGEPPENAPGISCKRREVLRLDLDEYRSRAESVTRGFERAAKLLYGLNIFASRDLPYRTQIIPLAAILAELDTGSDLYGVRAKLARWYWCGVFGELYGSAVETQFARDLPEVLNWIADGPEPSTITEANFAADRLLTLRTRNSAAYKGLYALLLGKQCLDFRTGETIDQQVYFDDKIDIHHIFPQDWCRRNGIGPKQCDSIVNKTPISARTNRMVGGKAPGEYLGRIQKSAGISLDRLDLILRSHLIDPGSLRENDFDRFFAAREATLLNLIQEAMGKPINREFRVKGEEADVDYETQDGETIS